MDPETERLLDGFDRGEIPLLQFMASIHSIRETRGFEPEGLGKAVVASFGRHTEGRDLMACILAAFGFGIVVAERDSTAEEAVGLCKDPDVSVLCYSVQTTYDCPDLFETSNYLKEAGIRDRIVLNVGGSPVTEEMARDLECDVFSRTAVQSARLIKEAVLRKRSRSGVLSKIA
jgi:methanogenic corrinoid protein MtbC1